MQNRLEEEIFEHFITRKGDRLFEGDQEFKFVSINIPNLHVNEDPLPHWHCMDSWEIADAFKTIRLMGGRATRMYTFSVKNGIRPGSAGAVHIPAPRQFNEKLFVDLDKVLQLANEYKIRLIIPFIDQWDWFGGIKQFAELRGKKAVDFWTDDELLEDFKCLITFVLNRVNTITGVRYKDDKAIMAWETGNELDSSDAWIAQVTAHIRSLDSSHLIVDGNYGVSPASLDNPNVDIVSNHYYIDRGADLNARLNHDRGLSAGKKPLIVGEFGSQDTAVIQSLLDDVVDNGTSGAMLWSLRYHSKEGGFYFQGNRKDPTNICYNWPGFSTHAGGELEKLNYIRHCAYRIQGLPIPPKFVPEAPILLMISSLDNIRWKGSAGAESYVVERALNPIGEWTIIAREVFEDMQPYIPFQDKPNTDAIYHYRIRAQNISGVSEPSNVQAFEYMMEGLKKWKA